MKLHQIWKSNYRRKERRAKGPNPSKHLIIHQNLSPKAQTAPR